MVVAFHLGEAHAASYLDQVINHAATRRPIFLFCSRASSSATPTTTAGAAFTLKGFFRARLIRLQPMVVLGMVIGALGFYFQAAAAVARALPGVPVWKMLLVMLIGSHAAAGAGARSTSGAGRRCTRSAGRAGRCSSSISPMCSTRLGLAQAL
ncbi:MAG: hypothetical protein WKG07_43400 [Hymenobacter sp.]